ncbi:hypothetical protein GVN16_22385 [Emticicia sp. CRIBPO]|nr:hypothetical protein [Emticicia sp. CRIBPO]NBA88539.1 hypothetical protein [Emticicia sp. CRIBPO]
MLRAIAGIFAFEEAFEKAVFLFVPPALFSLATLVDFGFCSRCGGKTF